MAPKHPKPALAPRILLPALALLMIAGVLWQRSGNPAERAYEKLATTEIVVNTDYELKEQEPMPDGTDGRVGRVEAAYEGPNIFDVIQITVYESEPEAEDAWEKHLDESMEEGRSTRGVRPPYGQVCATKNGTVKCSVQMYEAVIVVMAGLPDDDRPYKIMESGVHSLLRAGVKNWLVARGLHLTPIDLSSGAVRAS